jgi:hypothetical protein
MDFIRGAYRTEMRFFPDGPSVPVQWYFTRPGAALFSGQNCFFSRNWEDKANDPFDHLGEQPVSRPWRNGQSSPLYIGSRFCDATTWYSVGQPVPNLARDTTVQGVPVCCSNKCDDAYEAFGVFDPRIRGCGGVDIVGGLNSSWG